MQIKADVRAVRDEDPLTRVRQALGFQRRQFFEETRDVDDCARTDEVDAARRDQARGQDVEVVGDGVVDDGVAGVCICQSCALALAR